MFSEKFRFYNRIVGVILFNIYYLHLVFGIECFQKLFNRKIFLADSWWYLPLKYTWETGKYLFYYPDDLVSPEFLAKINETIHIGLSEKYPDKYAYFPYTKMNDPVPPETESEIAQAFFKRLFEEGTWLYFVLFIFYIAFSFFLFWEFYSFLKVNRSQLLSFKFLNVLKQQIKLLHFIYILLWCLLQVLFFQLDLIEIYNSEWYYALTTVLFIMSTDFITGTFTLHNSLGIHFHGGDKEKAFWFFKGKHLEFFSVYLAVFLGITVFLDCIGLLPIT